MNQNDLKPANDFAQLMGVKAVIFGAAGSGKTPIINTAPRPVLLACEPGLLSMRGSTVPTYQAFTASKIDEFFTWLNKSNEAKSFDTVAVDSISQMADIFLQDAKKNIKHGLQQYGEMAEKTMKHLRDLYFMQYKHTYLISKEEIKTINNVNFKRPYMPGQLLPIEVPHQFDAILHLAKVPVPQVGETLAFRCVGSYDVLARERTGKAIEFEPPDFGKLVNKIMN
jgi:hypothetical protein